MSSWARVAVVVLLCVCSWQVSESGVLNRHFSGVLNTWRKQEIKHDKLFLLVGGKSMENIIVGKKEESVYTTRFWTKRIGSWFKKAKNVLFGARKLPILPKSKSKSKPISIPIAKTKTATSTSTMTSSGLARIQKELQEFRSHPPSHCSVETGSNIRQWIVTIKGANGTLYEGETYKLQFKFPRDYPSKPPSVYFLKPVPRHVHVYTNGDICLNLIGRDWRPGITAESIAISILSMLSSAKEKKLPPDNAMNSDNAPGQQQQNWMYHDDRC